jgi:hypothetical protein
MAKIKTCSFCNQETTKLWHANPKCCTKYECRKRYQQQKSSSTSIAKSSIKTNPRKATGELKLFMKIYAEKNGICDITKEFIPFNVSNFIHILSKGAYNKFRLYEKNIIHAKPRIHHLYDCSDKESLLKEFPEAEIIYTKKEALKKEYYEN